MFLLGGCQGEGLNGGEGNGAESGIMGTRRPPPILRIAGSPAQAAEEVKTQKTPTTTRKYGKIRGSRVVP